MTQKQIDEQMQVTAKNSKTMVGKKSPDITKIMSQYKVAIAQALPKHITPERVIQMAVTMLSRSPELRECTTASFIGAIMNASILGLRPVPALGQCYFVPYRNKKNNTREVQFQIGYKGYIDLARRSGQVKSIYAECVYEGDHFEYELGLYPKIDHKPCDDCDRENMSAITHAYAVAHYKDGGYNFIVLSRQQIERLRLRNPMQKTQPTMAWKTDYDKMACAKAIKQLAKYMPLSDEQVNAIHTDEAVITPDKFANDASGELIDLEYPEFEETETQTEDEENSDKAEK